MTSKVLFILTNTTEFGKKEGGAIQTGADLQETAQAYLAFQQRQKEQEQPCQIEFASLKGGQIQFDPKSVERCKGMAGVMKDFYEREEIQACMKSTMAVNQLSLRDYSCIYFPGGHGPMFDLATDTTLHGAIGEYYQNGGILGAVCHGPCGFLDARRGDKTWLVAGQKVTCWSNEEERQAGMYHLMPFLLENALKERGAIFECAKPHECNVVCSERLVTGQNPASTVGVAQALISMIKAGKSACEKHGKEQPVSAASSDSTISGK